MNALALVKRLGFLSGTDARRTSRRRTRDVTPFDHPHAYLPTYLLGDRRSTSPPSSSNHPFTFVHVPRTRTTTVLARLPTYLLTHHVLQEEDTPHLICTHLQNIRPRQVQKRKIVWLRPTGFEPARPKAEELESPALTTLPQSLTPPHPPALSWRRPPCRSCSARCSGRPLRPRAWRGRISAAGAVAGSAPKPCP